MNKTKTFYFHEQRHREACQVFLNTIKIGPGEQVWEARFRPHKKNRSLAQQALMWIWHGQWCGYTGDSEADEHIRFKSKYLLPIMLRDDILPGLFELYTAAVIKQCEGNHVAIYAIYELISTTKLNTAQFSEILNQYQQDSAMAGCMFTVRGPQYDEAMGR